MTLEHLQLARDICLEGLDEDETLPELEQISLNIFRHTEFLHNSVKTKK